jgi:ankyrin repeat protein
MAAVGSAPAPPPPPPPGPAPDCAQCGGPATERCAGCRGVHYCGRPCQRASWPAHKVRCKLTMSANFGGKQLASERDFVLEFWAPHLPAAYDADLLLPVGEPLDAAGAFERCRAAAMDAVLPGYSQLPEGERDVALDELAHDLVAAGGRSGPKLVVRCIERLCPAALGKLLAAGVKPGDVATGGRSLLFWALNTLSKPYPLSTAALPHALASLRALLACAKPSDWLVGLHGKELPLYVAACIPDPVAAQAVLDVIVESPGGFPAHAVAASPSILHTALQTSTASFVAALLAAGADPVALVALGDGKKPPARPLHALAIENPLGDARDFGDKLRLLLGAGVDLEAKNSRSWTALFMAAYQGRLVAFDALLAAGARVSSLRADIESDAARSATVLHQLAAKNIAALIPRVLATGALDVDVRTGPADDLMRGTPLHIAVQHDAPLAVSALLAGGASLAATDARGATALHLAIAYSSAKAARPLVEATPAAARSQYKRMAAAAVAMLVRDAAARPGDAAAAAKLAAARAIAALLA